MEHGKNASDKAYRYAERQYKKADPLVAIVGVASIFVGVVFLAHILRRSEPGIPLFINVAFDGVAVLFFGMFILAAVWMPYGWIIRRPARIAEYVFLVTEDALIFRPGPKAIRMPWGSITRLQGPHRQNGSYTITYDEKRLCIQSHVLDLEELIAQIAERTPSAVRE
jgi:hypothetical protein